MHKEVKALRPKTSCSRSHQAKVPWCHVKINLLWHFFLKIKNEEEEYEGRKTVYVREREVLGI